MLVKVKLFATFREKRFSEKEMDVAEAISLENLMNILEIPTEQVGILLVNGQSSSPEHKLAARDVVTIFPAIGGG